MQGEDQIRQAIAHSWAHTAQLSTTAPDLQDRLFELGMAQLRLQTQVRGATVPEQEGVPAMSVSEAVHVAYLQAGLGKPHQGSAADDHELQVFEMYDMISMDDPEDEQAAEVNAVADIGEAVTLAEVKAAQEGDAFAGDMKQYVTSGKMPENKTRAKTIATHAHVYGVIDGMLVRTARSKHGMYELRAQWYIPKGD